MVKNAVFLVSDPNKGQKVKLAKFLLHFFSYHIKMTLTNFQWISTQSSGKGGLVSVCNTNFPPIQELSRSMRNSTD